MLTEWLWEYEYFVNLRKKADSATNYLIYGNIMLF